MKKVSISRILLIVFSVLIILLILIKLLSIFNIPVLPNSFCSLYGFEKSAPLTLEGQFKCPVGCVDKHPDYSNCPPGAFCGLQLSKCIGW